MPGHYQFSYEWDLGSGILYSGSSALLRCLRVLHRRGQHPGQLCYLIYRTYDHRDYVLGTLCHAKSGRLIFFPGLQERDALWWTSGTKGQLEQGAITDHITIEADRKSGHVKFLEASGSEAGRLPNFTPVSPAKGVLYLFGLSIRGEGVLESVPNQFSLDFPEHEGKDLVRFLEEAFRGATHFIVTLPSGETLDADKFLHFDFLLARPGFENSAKLYNPPTAPPVLREDVEPSSEALVRANPIQIRGLRETVRIGVSQQTGTLTSPAIITICG